MEQREHDGVGADADREREDGRDREDRLLEQRAHAAAHVGDERLEPDDQVVLADVVALDGVIPEAAARFETRRFGRGAGGDQLVGALGDVERELAIDVVGDLPGAEDVDQSGEPGHRGLLRRLRGLQHALDAGPQPCPALFLERQLLPPGPGDGVVARLPVLVGDAPFGLEPAGLGHAVQRGIERPFLDAQQIGRRALDPRRDRVAVPPLAVAQRPEDEQDQRALEDVVLPACHA